MLDIETCSTKPNAMILSIAAIKFSRITEITPELKNMETFYVRIDQKSCDKLDMDIDPETMKWWKTQSQKSQDEVFGKDIIRSDIKTALQALSDFVKGASHIWANSPNFDCVILESAYRMCEMTQPWKFWCLRDTRTIYDIGKINLKTFVQNSDTQHNALFDSYYQICALHAAYQNINNDLKHNKKSRKF